MKHYTLNWKDKFGYDFEFECGSEVKQAGLGAFIKFTNSMNPYLWLKNKCKGVDMIIHKGKHRFYIEDRFQSYFYNYRTQWFQESTVQRFHNYPLGEFDHHIVCTNRPEVYKSPPIQEIANSQGISILTIQQLIDLISSIPDTIPITNNEVTNTTNNNVYDPITYNEIVIEEMLESELIKKIECERLRALYSG